jgi:hypothetical protein
VTPSLEQVRVAGVWLNDIAPWGDLETSTSWGSGGGGCDEAVWSMAFPPMGRHRALVRGALVECFIGSTRTWMGTLGQPDWSEGTFKADGLGKLAGKYQAVDASLSATSDVNTAIDRAIVRGLPWTRSASFGSGSWSATSDSLNTLGDLLDLVADYYGSRWAVFEDGVIFRAPDPTIPTWQVAPGVIDLGEDDGDYASTVMGRYLDSATSTYLTVTATDTKAAGVYGTAEHPVDLTDLGPRSTTFAQTLVNGILANGRAKIGWANDVEVGPYELRTMGGLPADLSMVRAGQVVRVHGVYDQLNLTPYRDLVLGKVSRRSSSSTITLAPVDTQPQDVTDEVAATMRAATKTKFRA